MYLSSAVRTPRCQASGPNRADVATQRFGSDFEKATDRVREEGEAALAATNGANGGAKKPGKTAV